MRRYHSETAIIRSNHWEHLRMHGWSKKPVECLCDQQAGRFCKRDAHDCGKTRCTVCHYDKWLNDGGHEPTRRELLAEQRMREGEAEL